MAVALLVAVVDVIIMSLEVEFSYKHSGCLAPITLKSRSLPHARTYSHDVVPCGTCATCLSRKRNAWSFRLTQESKVSTSAYFITLTYSDENLRLCSNSAHPTLSKRDCQLFFKRLRKFLGESRIRYFITGEYGGETLRPHYHLLLFNSPSSHSGIALQDYIDSCWRLGHIHIGSVTEASIAYVTKYVITPPFFPEGCEPPFSLKSSRPGLGSNYLDTHPKSPCGDDRYYVVMPGGSRSALPRFYRERLFSESSRRQHARDCAPQAPSDTDISRAQRKLKGNPFKLQALSKVKHQLDSDRHSIKLDKF